MKPTLVSALNKPRLWLGFDPKALFVCFAAGAALALAHHEIIGGVLAIGANWKLRNWTRHDAAYLRIQTKVFGQKAVYDPFQRDRMRVVIEG